MKKLFLICGLIVLTTGCGNKTSNLSNDYRSNTLSRKVEISENNIANYQTSDLSDKFEGRDVLPGEAEIYYTFTGESTHFYFDNGIADYRDDKIEFMIQGLKSKNNEPFTATFNVYFNNKHHSQSWLNNEMLEENDILVGERGEKIYRAEDGNWYGEFDSFIETRPEDFEKAIEVAANYCNDKNNCSKEIFKLDVTKHE